jgi:hypothetical protein
MSRTDTAARTSASPDRVFAALTDPDALARARLARPKRDTGRHFRSVHNASAWLTTRRAPGSDNTRSSGAGVELAPALPEARPPIRARTSKPAHFGDPTGTVSCEVGVGAVGVPGNGNRGRASPVHHEHGVWRPSAGSRIDTNPDG